MNTRIQVEHTVTELLLGLDLVEWQLREACKLSSEALAREVLSARGHAIEARVYAEDARAGFVPDTGTLHHMDLARMPFVRWDVGIEQGGRVTPHFDPMIAKLVVWGRTRDEALERLSLALDHTHIHGVRTNLGFLRALAEAAAFREDRHDTSFIEREFLPQLAPDLTFSSEAEATLLARPQASSSSTLEPQDLRWKLRHRS